MFYIFHLHIICFLKFAINEVWSCKIKFFKNCLEGTVKKAVGAILKIVHAEPIASENVSDFENAQQRRGDAENEKQRELGQLMGAAKFTLLDPLKVLDIFRRIEMKAMQNFFLIFIFSIFMSNFWLLKHF